MVGTLGRLAASYRTILGQRSTSGNLYTSHSIRNVSSKQKPDKQRVLEKPTRFNPPSHGSRRTRPRTYGGPRLSDAQFEAQKTKKYPNMMPPEGTFMHWFLNDRRLHLWISLSTLTSLAVYTVFASFVHNTEFRDQLPTAKDFFRTPFSAISQFLQVYKLHVASESEKVADKRRRKLEDVQKRKEFLREHGVEPGFLTGSWMEKFGTIESDKAREAMKSERESPAIDAAVGSPINQSANLASGSSDQTPQQPHKKPKMWLGIW